MSLEAETRIALNRIMDPELRRSTIELGMIRDLEVSNKHVSFTLALVNLASQPRYDMVEQALEAVSRLDGCGSVTINLVGMTPEERQGVMRIARQRTAPAKAEGLPVQVHLSGADPPG